MPTPPREIDPAPGVLLERLLGARHSCRGFLPRPVDTAVIEEILGLAQKTASWCNSQPWRVDLISGPALERLRPRFFEQASANPPVTDLPFPTAYLGIYQERRRECAARLFESVGIPWGDREASGRQARENFRFFGAPHLAVISSDANLGVYGAVDCGAYVGNFLLAAQAHGVATIAQASIATQSPFLHTELDIPEDRLIVCGVSFGYEDGEHPANGFRTSRAALPEVVRWVTE